MVGSGKVESEGIGTGVKIGTADAAGSGVADDPSPSEVIGSLLRVDCVAEAF